MKISWSGMPLISARLGGDQANADAKRGAVGHVALAALFDRILGLAQRMLANSRIRLPVKSLMGEIEAKASARPSVLNQVKASLLQLDEVGHFEHVRNFAKGKPFALGARLRTLLDRERAGRHRKGRGHGARVADSVRSHLRRGSRAALDLPLVSPELFAGDFGAVVFAIILFLGG